MTTADTVGAGVACIPVKVFNHVCLGIARGNIADGYRKLGTGSSPEGRMASVRWWSGTVDAVCGLPLGELDRRDGRKPLDPGAVGDLLLLLRAVLEDKTLPPTSVIPTWRGGVTAEWHVNGFDLEVGADPDGTRTYFFGGPGVPESEGLVEEGFDELKRFVTLLPTSSSPKCLK